MIHGLARLMLSMHNQLATVNISCVFGKLVTKALMYDPATGEGLVDSVGNYM